MEREASKQNTPEARQACPKTKSGNFLRLHPLEAISERGVALLVALYGRLAARALPGQKPGDPEVSLQRLHVVPYAQLPEVVDDLSQFPLVVLGAAVVQDVLALEVHGGLLLLLLAEQVLGDGAQLGRAAAALHRRLVAALSV